MAKYSQDSAQQYKNYGKRTRAMYTEESFATGMVYATSPLATGSVKNLINVDLDLESEALTPRDSIRAFEITQSPISECDAYLDDNLIVKEVLYGSEVTEENGMAYKQVVLGEIHMPTEISNSKVTCPSRLITGLPDLGIKYPDPENILSMADESMRTNRQYSSDIYHLHCIRPNVREIHGIPIENPAHLTELIGTTLTVNNAARLYCFADAKLPFQQDDVWYPAGSHLMFSTFENDRYVLKKLLPYQATANDATNSMYNMLLDDPYSFQNKNTALVFTLMGLYPVDRETGKAVPLYYTYKNNSYRLKVQYDCKTGEGASKYLVRWSLQTGTSANFDLVKEEIVDMANVSEPPEIFLDWSSNTTACVLRIEVHKWEEYSTYNFTTKEMETVTGFNPVACSVLPVALTFADNLADSSKVLDYTTYDLTTAKGMCTWRQRLVLWAPEKASQAIFISEPNNPTWFPYPKGLCLFPDNVIKCVPYLDSLLVFTTAEIYLISLAEGGDTWTQVCLQKNLHITEADGYFIKSIKNMVFYKSNNFFYMLVPSSTSINGVTVAPITTNITYLLEHFSEGLEESLQDLYNRQLTVYIDKEYDENKDWLKLICFNNYVDYKRVYNVYTFKDRNGVYLNYYLVYDTTTRAWVSYILESHSLIKPFKLDVSGLNEYMSYVPVVLINERGTKVVSHSIQLLHRDSSYVKDFYVFPYQQPEQYSLTPYALENHCYDNIKYPNYQLVDTGAREQESDFKKRYRELQIQLNNIDQKMLMFSTMFSIDGHARQDSYEYEVQEITDSKSDRFGEIVYQRVDDFLNIDYTLGATELEDPDNTDPVVPVNWRMDVSQFPDTHYWKLRLPVSGKGYTPRLKIITTGLVKYELLNISWVFRLMYAR